MPVKKKKKKVPLMLCGDMVIHDFKWQQSMQAKGVSNDLANFAAGCWVI